MLLTVSAPTRLRPDALRRMVASVFASVEEQSEVEVLLRAYEDDEETLRMLPSLTKIGNVRWVVRRNLRWCGNDLTYLRELYEESRGDWVLGFDDDALIEDGFKGWEQQLRHHPLSGVYLEPSSYKSNGHPWGNTWGPIPFKVLPRTWMTQLKLDDPTYTTNIWSNDILSRCGWRPRRIRLGIDHIQIVDAQRTEEGRI